MRRLARVNLAALVWTVLFALLGAMLLIVAFPLMLIVTPFVVVGFVAAVVLSSVADSLFPAPAALLAASGRGSPSQTAWPQTQAAGRAPGVGAQATAGRPVDDQPPSTTGMRLLIVGMFAFFLAMGLTAIAAGLEQGARVLLVVFVAGVGVPSLLIGWTATMGWRPAPPLEAPIAAPTPRWEEIDAVIRSSVLLAGLPDEKARMVMAMGQVDYVGAGTRLAQAGIRGDRIFIIADGRVQLTGVSELGEVTVRVAGPGESFPVAALIGDGTLFSNAVAMTRVALMSIPAARLVELCRADHDVGIQIFKTAAEVLGERYRVMLARHLSGIGGIVRSRQLSVHI